MKLKHVDDPMVETVLTKKAYKKGKKTKENEKSYCIICP